MKLGLNLGYWGAGQRRRQPRPRPRGRPARLRGRLGRGGLRLRRGHGARLGRRADRADRRRLGGLPDPRPHAGQHRDDGRDARHAVRRPLPARPGRLRAAGLRGLARRALRQAAGPHPRVRRDRAQGAGAREGRLRRRVLHAAAAGRPGQGAHPHRAPGAREHPDLPRGHRPEEPRAHRRDRRRLAGDLLLARELRRDHGAAARRAARRSGKSMEGSTSSRPSPSCSATTRRRAPTRSAPTPPSTSAAWAAATRTSTTSSPRAWATSEAAAEVQDKYLARDYAAQRLPCRSSSSTAPR